MGHKDSELKHAGDTNLKDLADPLLPSLVMQEVADIRMEYPGLKEEHLWESMVSTFACEDCLKAVKNRKFYNTIFHYAVDKLVCRDCDSGVGRYSSTRECFN